MSARIIHIEALAPPKPVMGAVCNGCGVCCLTEPCPVGMLLSRRRRGACVALRWDTTQRIYRCGVLGSGRGGFWRWLVRRWIAAGQGCDCSLEVAPASKGTSL